MLALTGFTHQQAAALRAVLATARCDTFDQTFTYQQAAQMLGVSERTLRRRVAADAIPYRRSPSGRMVRFTRRDIAQILSMSKRGVLALLVGGCATATVDAVTAFAVLLWA